MEECWVGRSESRMTLAGQASAGPQWLDVRTIAPSHFPTKAVEVCTDSFR